MRRLLYTLANALAGAVIILLVLDPTQPLAWAFVLLALAVVCAIAARLLPR
jgi:hypothetical protein